jgi:aspartyl-tRNA(Asn)/glutamyl-tRNA(Gln) amidotransferase subunit B
MSQTWEAIIGLEVHCQLKTRTKIFCGCRNAFGAPPNSQTCPVCTGQPGALPVLNQEALALGVRAGLAMGCEIAGENHFDRKNYFYCDLPKGYQITQFERPFAAGGGLDLASGRRIRLNRIHLEEDAGKAIHDRGETTLVDLNRAGVPLIEAVTEADMHTSAEAHEFLTAYKSILQYAGVSDCDMEKGSLRCDVNVSVHHPGEPWRTKVEMKNLNSFRNVADSIEHEIERQTRRYEEGLEVAQETRLFDPGTGTTRPMRTKEDEHDYRYFPDPDLPVAIVDAEMLSEQRAAIPELPPARRARYQGQLGLSAYDAGVLTAEREVATFFEEVAERVDPKAAANWISNELLSALGDDEVPGSTIAELRVDAASLSQLIALVQDGAINRGAGRQVLARMLTHGGTAPALVKELGLEQVSDDGAIEEWCRAALEGKDSVVASVRDGNEKALGALFGPVMKASGGKANPKIVRETLLRLIHGEGASGG